MSDVMRATDELREAAHRAASGRHLSEWFDDRIHLHPYRQPPFLSDRPARTEGFTDLLAQHWDVSRPKVLYVHIPFCSSICPYCPFTKQRANDRAIKSYLEGLHRQVSELAAAVGPERIRQSVVPALYFGGGSPTSLSATELGELAAHVADALGVDPDAEVTFELRIVDLDDGYLARVVEDSVATRLSFGVQSFDTARRATLGRHAPREKVTETVGEAVSSGKTVNVDLMYGLPEQTSAEWAAELDTMLTTGAQACSTYRLNLHEPTRFGLLSRKGRLASRPDQRAELEMFMITEEMLVDARGWRPCTPANYGDARSEKGYYNFAQLDHGHDIIALGVGAHGQVGGECYRNPSSVGEFVDASSSGGEASVRSLGDHFMLARDLLCLTVGQSVSRATLIEDARCAELLELFTSAGMIADERSASVSLSREGLYWSRNLYYVAQRVLRDAFAA
jgi:anaerobilin synthase